MLPLSQERERKGEESISSRIESIPSLSISIIESIDAQIQARSIPSSPCSESPKSAVALRLRISILFARNVHSIRLLKARMNPIFVFNGQPPYLKKQDLAKRYSKREDATKNLNAAIEVYAVASEDMDSLTLGALKFLCHIMEPSSKKIAIMEFEVAKVMEEL